MSETPDPQDGEHAARIDSALAESQRLEREEREEALARQHSADERIVQALADKSSPSSAPTEN